MVDAAAERASTGDGSMAFPHLGGGEGQSAERIHVDPDLQAGADGETQA